MTNSQNSMQVVSLNVYHGYFPDELSAYLRDKKDDTAVFCFQETGSEVREILDNILSDDYAMVYATKTVEGEQYFVSTYVRSDIQVADTTIVREHDDSCGIAQSIQLIDAKGRKACIVNVHGNARPGNKLDTPSRVLFSRHLIDAARGSDDIQVIAGDFNLSPETESVKMFEQNGYHDLIKEFQIPTTRNEIAWQKHPPHMKQLFADYAFVRGKGMRYNFEVEDVIVSDHLPMTIQISY